MSHLNVAVVGLRFGCTWMNGFRNHPNCLLMHLCDIDEETLARAAAQSGVSNTFGHIDEVLANPDISAIAFFTPVPLHAEQSAAALKSGKHVLSAVPAPTTEAGCRKIVAAIGSPDAGT